MTDQNQASSANQPPQKNRPKAKEAAVLAEQASIQASLAQQPAEISRAEATDRQSVLQALLSSSHGALNSGSIEHQAARLGDPRLQTAQRQALATQIGRRHGNRHLQRVIISLKRADQAGGETGRLANSITAPAQISRHSGDNPTEASDAGTIQAQLSAGHPLDSGVKANMESIFGQNFAGVQVHTDARSAELAKGLDAGAFTVGEHITFGAGQYQPGSLIGDALIAHELAHVVQQQGASATAMSVQRAEAPSAALEADANLATTRAVISLWSGVKGSWANITQNALPSLRSGLRLQRCTSEQKKRFEEIKKILETIPTGKEALSLREKYDVKVDVSKPGGGSYYDSSSNTMFIDPNHSNERAALAFVHEMNHARYHHEGLSADAKSLSREEYVKKMVEEEAEGVIKSIEAKIELEGTAIDVSGTSYPLETEYRQAYKAAVDAAKLKDPKTSEEDLKRIGREAGKKRVIKGFMDGEVKTSTTKETYPDFYGKYWDKVNKT